MPGTYYFQGITLLITHYNRSSSLERLLESFKKLNCKFEDIVVSDDGSKQEHLDHIKELHAHYLFRLITTPKNRGLGNNINKGQDAITTPYTLYIQEDFVPLAAFPEKLQDALQFMNERKDLDMVRFYAYFKYPYLKPLKNGFSEMKFRIWYTGYKKFYMYSDHPHLRRSNFLQKFGRYPEGVNVEVSEYGMMMSFLKNNGKALFYEDFQGLLDQVNSTAEPSTFKRNFWRESENPVIALTRHAFRHLKFNYRFFKEPKK
ncbi:MAG: glycosyltransferase family 2 protein [Flavipsychrobacter sp.]|nr:glycosyltransferase family 2 protein [Flavipsychrobacter sp.]